MLLTLLLLACPPAKVVVDDTTLPAESTPPESLPADDSTPPESTPSVDLALLGPTVFDPVLGGPVGLAIDVSGAETVRVEVRDASGTLVATLADGSALVSAVTWDGQGTNGLQPVGAYTVEALGLVGGVAQATASAPLNLVRCGVLSGTLGGDGRQTLIWHRDGEAGRYYEADASSATFELSGLTDDEGLAQQVAAPWDDLDAPPEDLVGQTMPAAYTYDATPTFSFVFGGDGGGVDLSASMDGWNLTDDQIDEAGVFTFTLQDPLGEALGVYEHTWTLTWRADGEIVATQDLPMRIYLVLGPATFDEDGSPYAAWVAVIDPALRAIDSVPPNDTAVQSALVDYIYNDLGLTYDTVSGASAYMSYRGWSWADAHFNMSGFLKRSRGEIVNCSDCAGILSVHSNMLGAYMGQTIIEPSFNLNQIKSIGATDFTNCPFGSWGCGFSYHAVTSPDESSTIYDATLAVDGDEDPSTYPGTEKLVQDMSADEYLERLVMSGSPEYESYGTGTIQ